MRPERYHVRDLFRTLPAETVSPGKKSNKRNYLLVFNYLSIFSPAVSPFAASALLSMAGDE